MERVTVHQKLAKSRRIGIRIKHMKLRESRMMVGVVMDEYVLKKVK